MELLVTISIISLLMGITIPAFQGIRRKARIIGGMNNLKEIARGLNAFSLGHNDRYPPSVCTVGIRSKDWQWNDPRTIIAYQKRSNVQHRAMSAYLYDYINNAEILRCPSTPKRQKYLEEAWRAGDDWNLTSDGISNQAPTDPYKGAFCFYWNYMGLTATDPDAKEHSLVFKGPWGPASGRKYSKILASDFFNFGNGQNPPPNYGSCEKFSDAAINPDHDVSTSFWTTRGTDHPEIKPDVPLKSVFTDEHVETNDSLDAVPLWVISDRDDMTPRSATSITGIFYIPKTALPRLRTPITAQSSHRR